ncbi:NADP-dependent oxidoreductase [Arthrobacter crusticola]|uniref:NADP-dependent oxidoreductase n=1 Tax=Arthrobacter crusticola TaxID=2547960 RepID=A0A4R5TU03_9MICC|nr:NADP-dependent oxidoreductase [Arthrobacter crusticola]TDK24491.1 NADP-dependent oxidoreductase [Arthrobacter crusticola]
MKRVVYRAFGGPEQLVIEEAPLPRMAQDSVLVRVRGAAVNPADIAIQHGVMKDQMDTFFPVTPGWDVAGTVEAIGAGVSEFVPGDEVLGYTRQAVLHQGTYAEMVATPVGTLVHKPRSMTWAEAAALPLGGLTAYQAIVHTLRVRKGESVLIHGASGGVGSLASQIAIAQGARVIGTASASNHAYLASLGADPVAYGEHAAGRIRELAPAGVDAIFDAAGHGSLQMTGAVAAPQVRVATIADSAPHATTVYARLDAGDLEALAALVAGGKLKPRVGATFPLSQAAAAQRLVAAGSARGRVVLLPSLAAPGE